MTDPYAPPPGPGVPPPAGQQPPPYGQPQFGQPQYGQPQYGQPQYGQPQYGQPQYGGGYPAPQNSQDAVIALILAIAGYVFCPLILSVVALVFASKAQKAIAASGGALTGSGMATAAKVLAWIEIALVAGVVILLVGLTASGHSSNS